MNGIDQEKLERLNALSLRFDKIIWLPLAIQDFAASGDLEEFIEWQFPCRQDHELFDQLPVLKQFWDDDEIPEPEDVIEALYGGNVAGFLVQVARPVMRYNAEGSGATFSWGCYNFGWVFAESLDAVVDRAIRWGERHDQKQRKEAAAPKGGAA